MVTIRVATTEDAEILAEIYRPYVEDTAITFEYDVPSAEEFKERMESTLEAYPYIVAEDESGILGYAYASRFHTRHAFRFSAELSIYLKESERGKGVGTLLYAKMEELLKRQNIINLYGVIATTDRESDPYLTDASVIFHAKCGYVATTEHKNVGYKFGRWYNIVEMEKRIGELSETPAEFIPFPEVLKSF